MKKGSLAVSMVREGDIKTLKIIHGNVRDRVKTGGFLRG